MDIESISFRLDAFEGPLDLLLHLIGKNKVSIYDIPISLILEQYMEYIEAWQKLDLDIASEFIDMAAELMLIKSRMMLPKNKVEEEEDPRERLAAALIEYKNAKETAAMLGERYKVYHGRLTKEPEDIDPEIELRQHNILMLQTAFERIMRRSRADSGEQNSAPPERMLGNLLSYRVYSIPGKIIGIMKQLYLEGDCTFDDIMLRCESRGELITAFVALLELLRSQRIIIIDDGADTSSPTANSISINPLLRLDRSTHNRSAKVEVGDY